MKAVGLVVGAALVVAGVGACSGSKSSSSSSSSGCVGTSSPLCTGSGRCVAFASCATESDISAAFSNVQDGDTLAFSAGTYTFTNQLALGTASNVTVIGPGQGQTTLDFSGQVAGEDAIFAQGCNAISSEGDAGADASTPCGAGSAVSNLTFQGFSIQNSPGNAFKTLGLTGVTWRDIGVSWSAGDDTDGAYGLYPVQCTQVLIEGCTVSGASDSGIYVGQSQQIVVRNNTVFGNVAGIEIENSFFAEVHDNTSHDNTAGILVFALPGLEQDTGHDVFIHDNTIQNNNTKNFAIKSDIVSIVPAGTGFFVMANKNVEITANTITGNQTCAAGIISYATSQQPYNDPRYYEYPTNIWLHDNTYSGNGTLPDADSQVGLLLSTGMGSYPDGHVPDVMWDGIVDPNLPSGPDPQNICIHEPGASAVCDMHFDKVDMNNPNVSAMVCDPTPFACTGTSVAAVTWQGMPQ